MYYAAACFSLWRMCALFQQPCIASSVCLQHALHKLYAPLVSALGSLATVVHSMLCTNDVFMACYACIFGSGLGLDICCICINQGKHV